MIDQESEPKVSVYMITYNNEETIERALKSVTWADEIVIVDSFSNDRTVEIGRQFTDRLFQRKWPGHRDQYQYAADLTTHEWIMFVDADEEVSPELADEIRKVLKGRAEGVDGFLFTDRPSTWGDGFDLEVGIPTVRFVFIGERRGGGKGGFMRNWWSTGKWVS
jgi:glycosyltransferase involved in cell wall biosynthesis